MPSIKRADADRLRDIENKKKVVETKLRLQQGILALLRNRKQKIAYKDVSEVAGRSTVMVSNHYGTLENLIVQSVMPHYELHRDEIKTYCAVHGPVENLRHYVEELYAENQLAFMTAAYYHDEAFVKAGTKGLRKLISEGLVFILSSFGEIADVQRKAEFFVDALLASTVIRHRNTKDDIEFTVDQILHATSKALVSK